LMICSSSSRSRVVTAILRVLLLFATSWHTVLMWIQWRSLNILHLCRSWWLAGLISRSLRMPKEYMVTSSDHGFVCWLHFSIFLPTAICRRPLLLFCNKR
jgi:hypothetical protein